MNNTKIIKNSITVVIPTLNEEDNILGTIENTLGTFKHYNLTGELIVVNDGSTDETAEIVKELIKKDNRIRILTHEKPLGIGQSYWDGVNASRCDLVVLVPGDNEMDPRDVLRYINLMEHVDILVPFFINKEVRNRKRRILSATYRFIVNLSFGVGLNYTNGSVIYRRSILEKDLLRSKGFFYQTELLVKLIRKGYLYAEVPNFLLKRVGGDSKAVTLKSFIQVLSGYLSLFYDIHIKRIDTYRNNYRILNKDSVSFIQREKQKSRIDVSYYSG